MGRDQFPQGRGKSARILKALVEKGVRAVLLGDEWDLGNWTVGRTGYSDIKSIYKNKSLSSGMSLLV